MHPATSNRQEYKNQAQTPGPYSHVLKHWNLLEDCHCFVITPLSLHKLAGGQPGYKFILVKLLNPEGIGKVHVIHSEKSNPHITCRLESLAGLNRVALYSILLFKKWWLCFWCSLRGYYRKRSGSALNSNFHKLEKCLFWHWGWLSWCSDSCMYCTQGCNLDCSGGELERKSCSFSSRI